MEPLQSKKGIVHRLYDWVLSWAETRYGTPALFILAFLESSVFPVPPDVLQIALSTGKPKRAFWYATVCLAGSVLGAFLGFLIGYVFWASTQDFFYKYVISQEKFALVAGDEAAGIVLYQNAKPNDIRKNEMVSKIEMVCNSNTKARLRNKGFDWVRDADLLSENWQGTKRFDPPERLRKYVFQFSKTEEASDGQIVSALFYDDEGRVLDSFEREKRQGLYHEHGFWTILITAPTPIPYKLFTIAAGVCGISLWVLFIASIIGRGARFYTVAAIMYFFGPTVKTWIDRYVNLLMVIFAILVIVGFAAIKVLM